MGEPTSFHRLVSYSEYIAIAKVTRGTETSYYPEEEKENSISLVAASETETAQTSLRTGVVGLYIRSYKITL